MKLNHIVITTVVLITHFGFGAVPRPRCAGGEGGVPLNAISGSSTSGGKILHTDIPVENFVVFEAAKTLSYVSFEGQVLRQSFLTGKTEVVSQVARPLSRVVDPEGRFLLSQDPHYLDQNGVCGASWTPVPQVAGYENRPIFWNKQQLYTLDWAKKWNSKFLRGVQVFNPVTNTQRFCPITTAYGSEFEIADSGHTYPYIYLYRQFQSGSGYQFHIFRVNVEAGATKDQCQVEYHEYYPDVFPARVTKMHHFESQDGNIYQFDSSKNDLLWDRSCKFYDLEGRDPWILNNSTPIVATYSASEGLGVLRPDIGDRVLVSKIPVNHSVRMQDMWLSESGRDLLIAQIFDETLPKEPRILTHFNIDKLFK